MFIMKKLSKKEVVKDIELNTCWKKKSRRAVTFV